MPTPEEIARAQAQAEIEIEDEDRLKGSVMFTPDIPDTGAMESAYGPVDLALDIGSLGATSGGRLAGEKAIGLATKSALAKRLAGAGGALAGTGLYEATAGQLRSQPLSGIEVGTETALNTLIPMGGRALRSAALPGDAEASRFMASKPAQTAFEISERTNGMMRQATRLDPNNRMALEAIQQNADRGLTDVTSSQLGGFARDASTVRGASIDFKDKAPSVIMDDIFDKARSVSELVDLAKAKASSVGQERTNLINALDSQGVSIRTGQVYEKLQPIRDLAERYKQSPDTAKFGVALDSKLNELWNHLQNTATDVGGDSVVKASDLVTLSELTNEYRRVALSEFDKANIAAGARGDHPLTMEEQVAVDAFSKLGGIINRTIDELHNGVNNLPKETSTFSNLQSQYGGFRAVEDLARFQAENSAQGMAVKSSTNVTQTMGREPPTNAFNPTAGAKENLFSMGKNAYDAARGAPTGATKAYSSAVNRDTNLMQDIQGYRFLNQNPMNIPPGNNMPIRGWLIEQSGNLLGAGAMSYAQGNGSLDIGKQLNDLFLQQAHAAPLMSRDWETVKNDPMLMGELENRAVSLRLVAPGQMKTASDPIKKEIYKAVVNAFPDLTSPAPNNLNLIDGEFQNPMEKDAIVQDAMSKDPATRAKIISAAWQNKYVGDTPSVAKPPPQMDLPKLSDINDALTLAPNEFPTDTDFGNSPLMQLQKMTAIHDQDIQ